MQEASETLSTIGILIAILGFILTVIKSSFFVIFFAIFSFKQDLTECTACADFNVPLQAIDIDSLLQEQLDPYESCIRQSVNVTDSFQTLSTFLFATNMLLLATMFSFCCLGRNSAKTYDRLFSIYILLGFCNTINYTWLAFARFRHVGRVCSGDFLATSEQATTDTVVSEYYIESFGRLLKWYFLIETVLFSCCISLASCWFTQAQNATSRLFTTVEYQNAEAQQTILEEQIEIKRRLTDRAEIYANQP